MLHWEDFRVGEVTELGTVDVTEEDVIAFATRFDPQPFHVDPEAAKASPFGGLIASGWHTTALFMGLFVRGILLDSASLGSPGIESIRWTAPVRPGDTLSGRVTRDGLAPLGDQPAARNDHHHERGLQPERRARDDPDRTRPLRPANPRPRRRPKRSGGRYRKAANEPLVSDTCLTPV